MTAQTKQILAALVFSVVVFLIYAAVFRIAWNDVMPHMFSVKTLTFGQAVAAMIVFSMLGGMLFKSTIIMAGKGR